MYESLIAEMSAAIKANGNGDITGPVMQAELTRIISKVGLYAGYGGLAVPATDPGTPDDPVFYFATSVGTYANFSGIEITEEGTYILSYPGGVGGSWALVALAAGGVQNYEFSAYLDGAHTPQALTAGVTEKVVLPLAIPAGVPPRGFDLVSTPEGLALRFIGLNGPDSGETAVVSTEVSASMKSSVGSSDEVTFKAVTRTYNAALQEAFTAAREVPGMNIKRKMPNNDLGAVSVTGPLYQITAGDTFEIAVDTVSSITVAIVAYHSTVHQL